MKKTITALLLSLCSFAVLFAQDYTTVPENGSTVEMLTDITITWDNATTVTVDPMLMVGGGKLYSVAGEEKTYLTDILCGPTAGNSLVLTVLMPVTDAGEYVIEFVDNVFTVDGNAYPAFNLNYTIGGTPTSTATLEVIPAEDDLTSFIVTATPCTVLAVNEDESIEIPFIINNKGFDSYIAARYEVSINEDNTATLSTEKNLPSGNFTLHIPKGTFLIDGKLSQECVIDFTSSGINGILNDNATVEVYNLNGVQLVKEGSKEDLRKLDNGIYIVNGRKVMLRNGK